MMMTLHVTYSTAMQDDMFFKIRGTCNQFHFNQRIRNMAYNGVFDGNTISTHDYDAHVEKSYILETPTRQCTGSSMYCSGFRRMIAIGSQKYLASAKHWSSVFCRMELSPHLRVLRNSFWLCSCTRSWPIHLVWGRPIHIRRHQCSGYFYIWLGSPSWSGRLHTSWHLGKLPMLRSSIMF